MFRGKCSTVQLMHVTRNRLNPRNRVFLKTVVRPSIFQQSPAFYGAQSSLLSYLLTPWNTVLIEKLTVSQLVKKFPAFYGTQGSLLTHSMEQIPYREANGFSASQEIPRILWNPKVHYSFERNPSLASIWNRTSSVHCVPNI